MRLATALLSLALAGCGPSVLLDLPERFVVVEGPRTDDTSQYDIRATTTDGVVVGVRSIEHRVEGTLAFWSEATVARLRDQRGYALLSQDDTRSADGVEGRVLRFGRDLGQHEYRYTVVIYVTEGRLHLVEIGGRAEPFGESEAAVEEALGQIRLL